LVVVSKDWFAMIQVIKVRVKLLWWRFQDLAGSGLYRRRGSGSGSDCGWRKRDVICIVFFVKEVRGGLIFVIVKMGVRIRHVFVGVKGVVIGEAEW